jgi:molybdopterin synthase catalytic subunit
MSDINIKILYFAFIKELTGVSSESKRLPYDCTIFELLKNILVAYPQIKDLLKSIKVSVNYKVVDYNSVLKEGDEVALLPPISGG